MKLNEKKFFALAKESGLESADLTSNESSSLSVSIFHGEVDSLSNNSSYELYLWYFHIKYSSMGWGKRCSNRKRVNAKRILAAVQGV